MSELQKEKAENVSEQIKNIPVKVVQPCRIEPIKLKDDINAKNFVKIELSNVLLELEEVSVDKSVKLCKWILKKAKYTKKIYTRKFNRLPKQITRGDIIRVEFGINTGDELSDDSTDGHFALVWSQQGFTFLVIPLTKKPQINNRFSINLGKINGLPVDIDTYAKLDYMKWIYSIRIQWINEQPLGKIVIKNNIQLKEIIDKVKICMQENFIDN